MKISGRYWMYWGESDMYLATSMDLIHWRPAVRDDGNLLAVFTPRDGFFDSGLVEPGPPATLTNQGILLMYNSKNAKDTGDQSLLPGIYAAGQVLWPTPPIPLTSCGEPTGPSSNRTGRTN